MSSLSIPTYVSRLVDMLFTAPEAHTRKKISTFLTSITELDPVAVVQYQGDYYHRPTGQMVILKRGVSIPNKDLPPEHVPQFQALLNEQEVVNKDKKAITQLLTVLIDPCVSEQDLRDALPEMIVSDDMKLRLQRTRPAGYTAEGNRSLQRQYDKYYRKICLYAATKLIY